MKRHCFPLAALALAGLLGGCGKSETPAALPAKAPAAAATAAPPAETIARVHWLGMKRLAAETNAAGFLRIWNEPETARLKTQTLDKLATAPWRLMERIATTNPAAAPLLRPLLDDLVNAESYCEVRRATNQPAELVFAIRLSPERSALWETNLAAVLESLTGLRVMNAQSGGGWSLRKHEAPDLLEFTRSGDWTLVAAASGTNRLLAEAGPQIGLISRTRFGHSAVGGSAEDFWLEAYLELAKLGAAFARGWNLPAGFPQIALAVNGDGQNVRTRGNLTFSSALSLPLEPWTIPTNLLRGPLGGFTAVRGLAPWLASLQGWNDLQIGPPPSQVFSWSAAQNPMASFVAGRVPDASNSVSQLSQLLLQRFESWLETNRSGAFETSTQFHGLSWVGIPFTQPFLRSEGDFIFAGMFLNAGPLKPLPPLMLEALSPTNLVYYDWEITSLRMDLLWQVIQFLRFESRHAQLGPEAVATSWLRVNSTNSSLGPCTTTVFQTGPKDFAFARRSAGIGLSAMELQLLGDWLESPQFPRGLHTFLASQGMPYGRPQRKARLPLPAGSK